MWFHVLSAIVAIDFYDQGKIKIVTESVSTSTSCTAFSLHDLQLLMHSALLLVLDVRELLLLTHLLMTAADQS